MDMEQIRMERAKAEQRWLITFADLISLLLAFFVMLFAMSAVELETWKVLTNALSAKLDPAHQRDAEKPLTRQADDSVPLVQAADLDYLPRGNRRKAAERSDSVARANDHARRQIDHLAHGRRSVFS